MSDELSTREKWRWFLAGHDVGPLVSPLCDAWRLDVPYRWPYPEPDPFPEGHERHNLSEQMAMAGVCGWDATFLAGVPFRLRCATAEPTWQSVKEGDDTRVTARITTPYGDLTQVTLHQRTQRVVKSWLETPEDYRRACWLAETEMDYDEDVTIQGVQDLRRAVGDRGMIGTWFGPPVWYYANRDAFFYHLADWPEAIAELAAAAERLALKRVATMAKAGLDYLFYCVDGTEFISPTFFRQYLLEPTRRIFAAWRGEGRFVLWHSCGRVRKYVELGFFNELRPEVLETLSEPPVGDVPDLGWARQQLLPAIATKGNLSLATLLNGTPEEVRAGVRRIREQTRGFRHVVGLTDAVMPGTPLANALAFAEEGRRVE